MIKIFYRQGGEIVFSQSTTEFATISKENVLWIDLLEPSGDEKRATESFLGTEVQTRAQAEEIESSSRFYEEDGVIFANTNFLSPADDGMLMDPVSFILCNNILTTLRDVPIRSFNVIQQKMQALPKEFDNGFSVFSEIMDKRIDLDADIVEIISKDTSHFNKRVNQEEDINKEFLLDINQLQENAMLVRENVVDKQRMLSNILKSKQFPRNTEIRDDLGVILQDISSLISHINFTFERLEYLQDTALGLINLEQNNIMKIFTIFSVVFLPATLVASFYGMNVSLPFGGEWWTWLALLLLMLGMIVGIWIFAKRKKMM